MAAEKKNQIIKSGFAYKHFTTLNGLQWNKQKYGKLVDKTHTSFDNQAKMWLNSLQIREYSDKEQCVVTCNKVERVRLKEGMTKLESSSLFNGIKGASGESKVFRNANKRVVM